MKPRRVMVMIEMTSEANLAALSSPKWWNSVLHAATGDCWDVKQAQANVIRPVKKKGKKP